MIQIVYVTAGFAQSPPWKANGEAISARPDLTVRWQDSTKFPRKVWDYQLFPNGFSPEIISNVMMLCSFTERDKVGDDTNGVTFQSADRSRTLSISFASGNISYDIPEPHYSPTHLAEGVPKMSAMPELTKYFLQKTGVKLSEIQKGTNGAPHFNFWEPFTEFYLKSGGSITNVAFRAVVFRRSVDGAVVIGNTCELYFGEHGKISKIDFSWPNLKRIKSYPTVSQKEVIDFLRKGNAIRGPVPTSVGDIDWPSVKSVAVKKAVPSYQTDNNQLYPFLRLDVLVDTGSGTVEIGMDCPIIDETKP